MEESIEYELIDIEFASGYETLDEEATVASEDSPKADSTIEYDADGIPFGNTKKEIKIREKLIKDFYAKWISEHQDKAILNNYLNKKIFVKFLSINETYSKAARTYASTIAVFKLTDILVNAVLIDEVAPKNNKNQKQFEKILIMKYERVKLMVGLQRTTKEHVQYSISVPHQSDK